MDKNSLENIPLFTIGGDHKLRKAILTVNFNFYSRNGLEVSASNEENNSKYPKRCNPKKMTYT